ncbi:TPA: type II toxin-antitoxin system PemK/MazF family toxin, partial [Streptococcus equi subsp. equi]|nr:type II toxin-antitoxin system PemK/MazF family toxin [Streptococcus equi subsp. equi]
MGKIDKAARKFKFVSNSKISKFRFLPDWVLSEATYFEKEVIEPSQNHKIYKRGALVFVDFGVNVGSELSGHHFAIVLNKKDSFKNGVLTVIPVSSKGNKFSVKLDGFISQKSKEYLDKTLAQKQEGFYRYRAERIKKHNGKSKTHDELMQYEKQKWVYFKIAEEIKEVAKAYEKYNKVSYAKCLDIRTISKNRIMEINRFDPIGKIRVSDDTLTKIDKMI